MPGKGENIIIVTVANIRGFNGTNNPDILGRAERERPATGTTRRCVCW